MAAVAPFSFECGLLANPGSVLAEYAGPSWLPTTLKAPFTIYERGAPTQERPKGTGKHE